MNASHTDDTEEKQKSYQRSGSESGTDESPSKVEDLTRLRGQRAARAMLTQD
jgi:hypothetical protein